ncbi:NTP transferase domain-containing protein [Endozoicomonas sp. SCSIO W0465]|uniref:NTP transferase domain-containing protein n=1 Tax=Endozoicomonas sp. SCSIO W0465 TaxID=2918516 RepID=UPI002074BF04|nr:NTP transferase domain-containing protein [Endozoicomonas sp. SCSIO W0465]USE37711.1 NTP transferase domain-containing protein [Endozoicomonas sp. SCSIO W0465]
MSTDSTKPVDCLVTAAGLSSRMGRWKMMLPFSTKESTRESTKESTRTPGRDSSEAQECETILDCSIANALCFCQRVILVTGYRGEEIHTRYEHHPRIKLIHNPAYYLGLFSSIQAGIRHCETDYLFITHGDMPLIPPTVFSELWRQRDIDTLFPVVSADDQRPGHPVLLYRSAFGAVLDAPPQSRMKSLLLAGSHRFISVGTDAIHQDIDTPDRYRQLQLA